MIREPGMTLIVKTVTRLTVGLILLFGIYIVMHGHLTPGGGFAGGVIVALSFVHLMLAFGKDLALRKFSEPVAAVLESLGALFLMTIALLGFLGGYFFLNVYGKGEPFSMMSAFMILLANVAICFKVGAGLFAVVVVIVLARIGRNE
jgi:multicomponent Na+:H+ antiporter subunit B